MSVIDSERGVLVIRIVYDGPPLSGKTTSLRSLAKRLSAATVTSPGEVDGRTTFFDWVEYVGGLFDGRQIRCQIVSVPGQRELRHRRDMLLASADAVVFVCDSRTDSFVAGIKGLEDLATHCRTREPPVGIVVQANKRDAPDAVPRDTMRSALDAIAPMVLVDSIATDGEGVREAFVLAVRLALDRTRALATDGELPHGPPADDTPDDLLARLRSLEDNLEGKRRSIPPLGDVERLLPEPHGGAVAWTPGDEELFVPDPMMPGGRIWPPVDGRALLHEVARLGLSPLRTARGDWWASGHGWRFHSAGAAVFSDPHDARQRLVEWARLHASYTALLSKGRALILAEAGKLGQRLWQLLQTEAALRDRLAEVGQLEPQELASKLHQMAEHLLRARELLAESPIGLRCTLWTVSGDLGSKPRFVGLMPGPGDAPRMEPDDADLVMREFGPRLRELEQERTDYAAVRESLHELASRRDVAGVMLAELA
jgi:signal recognition particle receptor subunit beta